MLEDGPTIVPPIRIVADHQGLHESSGAKTGKNRGLLVERQQSIGDRIGRAKLLVSKP
jgi:hypothetical protein